MGTVYRHRLEETEAPTSLAPSVEGYTYRDPSKSLFPEVKDGVGGGEGQVEEKWRKSGARVAAVSGGGGAWYRELVGWWWWWGVVKCKGY